VAFVVFGGAELPNTKERWLNFFALGVHFLLVKCEASISPEVFLSPLHFVGGASFFTGGLFYPLAFLGVPLSSMEVFFSPLRF
jgi:hypothetical protein